MCFVFLQVIHNSFGFITLSNYIANHFSRRSTVFAVLIGRTFSRSVMSCQPREAQRPRKTTLPIDEYLHTASLDESTEASSVWPNSNEVDHPGYKSSRRWQSNAWQIRTGPTRRLDHYLPRIPIDLHVPGFQVSSHDFKISGDTDRASDLISGDQSMLIATEPRCIQ